MDQFQKQPGEGGVAPPGSPRPSEAAWNRALVFPPPADKTRTLLLLLLLLLLTPRLLPRRRWSYCCQRVHTCTNTCRRTRITSWQYTVKLARGAPVLSSCAISSLAGSTSRLARRATSTTSSGAFVRVSVSVRMSGSLLRVSMTSNSGVPIRATVGCCLLGWHMASSGGPCVNTGLIRKMVN